MKRRAQQEHRNKAEPKAVEEKLVRREAVYALACEQRYIREVGRLEMANYWRREIVWERQRCVLVYRELQRQAGGENG